MSDRVETSSTSGAPPTVCVAGVVEQPPGRSALQCVALIADTVLSPALATYTVRVSGLIASSIGLTPTGTTGAVSAHPAGCWALHCEASITETVLSSKFATYSV